MQPCNLLKRKLLYTLFIFSLRLSAQESPHVLFHESSVNFDSFKKSIKNDSVFSFRSEKGFIPSLLHNLGYQATSPFRMKGKQFILVGGCAIVTLSFIHYDQEIDDHIKSVKNNNEFINTVSPEITEFGDYYGYIALAGYGCYSVVFHKYRAFRTTLLATQAAITAGLWIRIGKILSGRMRPAVTYTDPEYNSDHWFGPFAQYKKEYNENRGIGAFDAFPSGHTGFAFAVATVFSEEYKDQKTIPIAMYSLAGLVGISRLIQHEHWASDVFLGAIIGYLCGKQVVENDHRLFPDYKISQKKSKSFFIPFNYAGISGVEWKMIF